MVTIKKGNVSVNTSCRTSGIEEILSPLRDTSDGQENTEVFRRLFELFNPPSITFSGKDKNAFFCLVDKNGTMVGSYADGNIRVQTTIRVRVVDNAVCGVSSINLTVWDMKTGYSRRDSKMIARSATLDFIRHNECQGHILLALSNAFGHRLFSTELRDTCTELCKSIGLPI